MSRSSKNGGTGMGNVQTQAIVDHNIIKPCTKSVKRMNIQICGDMVCAHGFHGEAVQVEITLQESKVHGYDVTQDDCFVHLELNFKFDSLSTMVNGVLGKTYKPNYKSRVKLSFVMPVMGGAHTFATSNLFATDCLVSNFGLKEKTLGSGEPLSLTRKGGPQGKGRVNKKRSLVYSWQ